MAIQYVQCCDCKTIHREGRLSYEPVSTRGPGSLRLRGSCPTCCCEHLEPVTNVCDECERHFAVPNDDLCELCIAVENDSIADWVLENIEPDRVDLGHLYRRAS